MKYMNPQEFKEKILNLKSSEEENLLTDESVKMEAIKLCSIFPELFGDDLDRLTLWNRIGSALETSVIKANYDIPYFVNLCLEHIKAEHSKVATHEYLSNFVEVNSAKSEEWKKAFFHYISTRYFLIIAKARSEWEKKKAERKQGGGK